MSQGVFGKFFIKEIKLHDLEQRSDNCRKTVSRFGKTGRLQFCGKNIFWKLWNKKSLWKRVLQTLFGDFFSTVI